MPKSDAFFLTRTKPDNRFGIRVQHSHIIKNAVSVDTLKSGKVDGGVALDARELDDLIVALRYFQLELLEEE